MPTKSKMFRGAVAADIRPGFRADVLQLASLPENKLNTLASILEDDVKTLLPTKSNTLARAIEAQIQVSAEQAKVLARGARSLTSQMTQANDKATDVADDLVSLQIIPPENKLAMQAFLERVQIARVHFVRRIARQEIAFGGGYHVTSATTYAELRAVFAEFDYPRTEIEKYAPELVELLPTVTLQLELHKGSEETKSVSIRLLEEDLADFENTLKVARLELDALKRKAKGIGK